MSFEANGFEEKTDAEEPDSIIAAVYKTHVDGKLEERSWIATEVLDDDSVLLFIEVGDDALDFVWIIRKGRRSSVGSHDGISMMWR